jgi:thymidylate synthase
MGIATPRFSVPPADFDQTLLTWFKAEEQVRLDPNAWPLEPAIADPFLLAALRTLRLKWGAAIWDFGRLCKELHACPDDDLTAAAYERLARRAPHLLKDIPQAACRRYFEATAGSGSPRKIPLKGAIDQLHRKKNAAYGGAWKRRGERVSILPNIARKVDRLAHFQETNLHIDGETPLDTAVDLLVYVLKYELFLAQDSPRLAADLGLAGTPRAYSDSDDDFTTALDNTTVGQHCDGDARIELAAAVALFEELWPRVDSGESLEDKAAGAAQLRRHADRLVSAIAKADPEVAEAFVRTWEAS